MVSEVYTCSIFVKPEQMSSTLSHLKEKLNEQKQEVFLAFRNDFERSQQEVLEWRRRRRRRSRERRGK